VKFGTFSTLQEVFRVVNLFLLPQVCCPPYRCFAHSKPEFNILTDGQHSRCPATHIKYPPKGASPEPTKTTTRGSEPTAPGTPFAGRGNLMVSTFNQQRGCVIGAGTWYNAGTCATFRAEKLSGVSESQTKQMRAMLKLT
jgi:hypothetical protein